MSGKIKENGIGTILLEKVISILMIFAMVIFSIVIARCQCRKMKDVLCYVGKRAFTIFIYSWPFQVVAEMLLTIVLKLDWTITFCVMFAVGLLGPLAIYEMYTRFRFIKRNSFWDGMIGVK
jgi:hypothetical protein